MRQLFDDAEFTTLRPEHFLDPCHAELPDTSTPHKAGDTVFVDPSGVKAVDVLLEPIILTQAVSCGEFSTVRVRRLKRNGRDYKNGAAPLNELVITDEEIDIRISDINARLSRCRTLALALAMLSTLPLKNEPALYCQC